MTVVRGAASPGISSSPSYVRPDDPVCCPIAHQRTPTCSGQPDTSVESVTMPTSSREDCSINGLLNLCVRPTRSVINWAEILALSYQPVRERLPSSTVIPGYTESSSWWPRAPDHRT